MEKVSQKTEIVSVVKVIFKIKNDKSIMPNRTIKEYWTLDGKYIGKIDPLDNYPLINESASDADISEAMK